MLTQLPKGYGMAQFDAHIDELYLEVIYQDIDGWLVERRRSSRRKGRRFARRCRETREFTGLMMKRLFGMPSQMR